jgi:hydrogenase/urease accessory protein HupE
MITSIFVSGSLEYFGKTSTFSLHPNINNSSASTVAGLVHPLQVV